MTTSDVVGFAVISIGILGGGLAGSFFSEHAMGAAIGLCLGVAIWRLVSRLWGVRDRTLE